jgi:hypothetical protein
MELPAQLQEFISTEIGWEYNPRMDGARCCRNMTAREYMGTYFPRSFVESYKIFELLLKNEYICKCLCKKNEINMIDIGSGTGGNLLGIFWFLKEKGFFNRDRDFVIYLRSIDRDNEGLQIQKKLIEQFFGSYIAADYTLKDFSSAQDLSGFLKNHLKRQGQVYDIMMCSKFINEFYTRESDYELNKGLYGEIVRIAENFLSDDGVLIMIDVTSPSFRPHGAFLPEIMSKEINEALNDPECGISHIQPLSCAFFQAKCTEPQKCFPQVTYEVKYNIPNFMNLCKPTKICFRVLTKRKFANKVLYSQREQTGYIIAEKDYGKINTCSCGRLTASSLKNDPDPQSKQLAKAYGW